MKRMALLLVATVTAAGAIALVVPAVGHAEGEVSPIYGVRLPTGYRDWSMTSVAHVGGNLNDLRVKLGNNVAIKAYREGKLPFPDGTIIARLAYRQVTSEENNELLRAILEKRLPPEAATKLPAESFVAGPTTNVQFMVKDSRKYASSGSWGFAQFSNGNPDDEAVHKTCFSCHEPAKDRDFVFTRYAP